MKTLLVTGASGRIASALRPILLQSYKLHLVDQKDVGPLEQGETLFVGSIADRTLVAKAASGCDAIIHLACVHGTHLGFEESLDSNYRGTLQLLEASVQAGARFVFASSHHIFGQLEKDSPVDETALAPDGFYALSKAFGEAACALYARKYGMPTLVVRVGNADPQALDARRQRLWISPHDLAKLVVLGVEHSDITYDIVYGVSDVKQPFFDNSRAFSLGYAPKDNADSNLAPTFTDYASMSEADGVGFIGGAYAPVLPHSTKDDHEDPIG